MQSSLLDTTKLWAATVRNGPALFGLDKRLTKSLAKMSLVHPTIVQSQVIPLALQGKDLLVQAKTGTGKTLAYLLPSLQKILSSLNASSSSSSTSTSAPSVKCVILVPTRELCDQLEKVLKQTLFYASDVITYCNLSAGTFETREARLGERPDVIVSTPGRFAEHFFHSSSSVGDDRLSSSFKSNNNKRKGNAASNNKKDSLGEAERESSNLRMPCVRFILPSICASRFED